MQRLEQSTQDYLMGDGLKMRLVEIAYPGKQLQLKIAYWNKQPIKLFVLSNVVIVSLFVTVLGSDAIAKSYPGMVRYLKFTNSEPVNQKSRGLHILFLRPYDIPTSCRTRPNGVIRAGTQPG